MLGIRYSYHFIIVTMSSIFSCHYLAQLSVGCAGTNAAFDSQNLGSTQEVLVNSLFFAG